MDFALHENLTTDREIAAVLERCWNWPGISAAKRAAGLADQRAESVLESISRLAIARMDVPRPEPQQHILGARGQLVARVDLGWADLGVVGEADGLSKYADPEVLQAEKLRQERLEKLGLVVVRWVWGDVTRNPRQLRSRLLDAFTRAEALQRSGSPRYWSVGASSTDQ
jgi:hypothetical protein